MDIATDGAAAPADTGFAPIETVAAPPSALSDGAPAPAASEGQEAKPAPTVREALTAAAAKVDAAQKDGDKTADKGTPLVRDEATGKFKPAAASKTDAAKPADGKVADQADGARPGDVKTPAIAAKPADGTKAAVDANGKTADADPAASASKSQPAPARFSADAKAAWEAAPEPVRAEVARMEREMTAGIEKYRVKAERDDQLNDFHQLAAKHGTDVKTALTRYTNMETLLRQNPLRGLEEICNNVGVSLRDVAQIVLGQTPDQVQSQSDATIRELRSQVAGLQQQIEGFGQRFQQQDQREATAVEERVTEWAASKPLFELLWPHIVKELESSGSRDLDQVYETVLQRHPQLAALASPPPASKPADTPVSKAASSAAEPDLEAQTRKGQKSIAGAPGSGSEPAAQPRSSSIKEALRRAAARAG